MPLKLNPAPLIAALEMVMLDEPVFVTDSASVLLFPVVTLPKLKLVGFDPSAPTGIPVPVSAMVNVGFAPSEVIASDPSLLPVD